ncbi:RNA polymerase factor sigma-54 [Lactobacillus xylocopicola]|uniref:RNA polymerase sigma-54 factor n=1 Tax=Lactobacillus xylocopicola TaxID=2976676 RepID=A0ABN6SK41_9LACO|nr:RNA polymerase factor sigma-54 [Lactobacillus xylocopicola]BDR59983.1 RNA polymerase sigma-54 factor [Lactobacillus xylocopicola]
MAQLQRLVLKPQEQLVTRLFLSPKLKQNLTVLSYSTYDLVNALKDLSERDPFVSLREPRAEMQNLEWLRAPAGENLVDHLLGQVRLSDWTSREQRAVKLLIFSLDSDGYLRADLANIATQTEFSLVDLNHARTLLQELDPCGIGTTNLNECLLLQARQKTNFDQVARQILEAGQLELLASPQQWPKSKFTEAELTQALACIQTLDPHPASEYVVDNNTQYLLPDLSYKVEDGRLTVESCQSQIPELIFDEPAYAELKDQAPQKKYFTEQKQDYLEMKNALDQRQKTIMRLGHFVGEVQQPFLMSLKKQELKPLGLKEASQALNLAPSTISRAIKDKYIQCQNKLFSLKILFPRQVTTDLSPARIEYDLQKIIAAEDQPLSDQQLVGIFAEAGVKLSRRVITKYRQKLNIPNSYGRKHKY